MSIYNISGNALYTAYGVSGSSLSAAYNINGNTIFPDTVIPVPSGDLTASETILLPDIYEQGKGFTCTGLAYDADSDTFLVGDIGALQPGDTMQSNIIRMPADFLTIEETIPLYNTFPDMGDIQGITVDTSDGTIWFCAHGENKIRNITAAGVSVGSISVSGPTGIAYSASEDAFWVLTYNNLILLVDKTGTTLESYTFAYEETLDQCFLDESRGLLYITAGSNYTGRNNVYCFDISTHEQSIACTVDSYSVEGIWLGDNDKMVILNDGYYHSATVNKNQVNIYTIE